MNTILLFIVAQIINVVLNTVKSILTVKGGKLAAAAINALTFGFYTYVLILIAGDNFDPLTKCIIVAACNFVGVYAVKLIEEKMRKDKLWEIRVTVPHGHQGTMDSLLNQQHIPHNYTAAGEWYIFNCYAATQADTENTLEDARICHGKTFASETKLL